jgi:Sigma-70, region 4
MTMAATGTAGRGAHRWFVRSSSRWRPLDYLTLLLRNDFRVTPVIPTTKITWPDTSIGQVYGVARERIRQIESKSMSKLRHPSRSQACAITWPSERQGLAKPAAVKVFWPASPVTAATNLRANSTSFDVLSAAIG